MHKKRILTMTAISFAVILILGCAVLFFISSQRSIGIKAPSQYAYQVCRQEMVNTDGYGVWKLRSKRFWVFEAQFEFYDGFNTATCTVTGFGSVWHVTSRLETLVGCVQSLSDTGGTECPRKKFGVSP